MEISESVFVAFNLLLEVVIYGTIPASIFVLLTLLQYMWERFKKYKQMEIKETEKILLGRAKEITKYDHQLERQELQAKKLNEELEVLIHRKKKLQEINKSLQDDGDLPEDDSSLETEIEENEVSSKEIDLDSMNIRDLKALAKERGMKMYSKKNKKQLLKMMKES